MANDMQILTNKYLSVKVNAFGAELSNITDINTGTEYLWQGNPEFWKRRSPVLFPIVGSLLNGKYRYKGDIYKMSQHGFARDNEFRLIYQSDNELRYSLLSNPETRKIYPFDFELQIGYKLEGKKIEVYWSVHNRGDETMYFQIGAHPAFYYPKFDIHSSERGYFRFDNQDKMDYILIGQKGCADIGKHTQITFDTERLMKINNDTFDKDALIIEGKQARQVSLLDNDKKTWLTVSFDAPLLGLWSPPFRHDCPFVCIEPWYGRCDRVGFDGTLENRDYMNILNAGTTFEAMYIIEIA